MEKTSPPSYNAARDDYPRAPVLPPNNQPMQYNQPAQLNQIPSYGFQQPYQMQQPQIYYAQSAGPVNFPLQQQAGPNTTIIVTGPTKYGPHPQHVVCPSCREHIQTKMTSENNHMTHLIAFLLCIFGCFLCSCIPYLMDSCKSQSHYCPQCNAYLGSYTSAREYY